MAALGLTRALEGHATVYTGGAPRVTPASIIICAEDVEGLQATIEDAKRANPNASVLVFSMRVDLPLARTAFRAGARGFIHAGMSPDQVARAVEVAARGEIVAPRQLVEHLLTNEDPVDLEMLSARQREALELVVEGLSNAQIAQRLYLSESTIKQHLRAAYKVLGVKNRNEAARMIRGR
jgi:DNA-binding NarL/FixJ family response regulator